MNEWMNEWMNDVYFHLSKTFINVKTKDSSTCINKSIMAMKWSKIKWNVCTVVVTVLTLTCIQ